MDLRFSAEEDAFRAEVRAFLGDRLEREFPELIGRGGPGDEHELFERRVAWERMLGQAGWACIGWPKAYGGRGASLNEQVIFYEEYARARAPGRIGHIGEGLLGPTLIAFGTEEQRRRFLPPIVRCEELWCQGYSEPNAGSVLANLQTRGELSGGEWIITGQKIWTSLAERADWCFALCRTDPSAPKHKGLSYLLVPMRQSGIEVRPISQMNGGSEFSEVFFDGAKTAADNVVGGVNGGWRVAMGTLAFERGASTLGQQFGFENELQQIITVAKANGAAQDPILRDRLARARIGLTVMRLNALRTLSLMQDGELRREAMIAKIYWASWHRELGKLAMDVLGASSEVGESEPYGLTALQRLFLFSRADTIYAGSNQIQRNIIAERALGLPPEPRSGKGST
jgi:alkylation response protein AidB-like acyl-CoA dehydrogenase